MIFVACGCTLKYILYVHARWCHSSNENEKSLTACTKVHILYLKCINSIFTILEDQNIDSENAQINFSIL
jgi:hypothetical protein